MIYNLTLNDRTQKKVLRNLKTTEKLLSKVATKLSSTQKECDIYAMSDLGIAHNVTRMRGGFFTGAVYNWKQSDIPFIPVDATINVCGTALYQINSSIQIEEFKQRCQKALLNTSKYEWNFTNGNHFISLCNVEDNDNLLGLKKGQYMIVHASACEYKDELYPTVGNWYYESIETETLDNYRYLRYIKGDKAERFYQMAKMLEVFNEERNDYFCNNVLAEEKGKRILNLNHYGMSSMNEILIGVQKTNGLATLLTSPGKSVYIVRKKENPENYYIPHGFGMELPETSDFSYYKDSIKIGNVEFTCGSIRIGEDGVNRHGFYEKENELDKYISKIVQKNQLEIGAKLKQICSFSAKGFQRWR